MSEPDSLGWLQNPIATAPGTDSLGARQSRIEMKKKSRHRNTALALIASIVLFPAAHSFARFDRVLRSTNDAAIVYDVRSFGAKGDSKTLDTPAINKPIDPTPPA